MARLFTAASSHVVTWADPNVVAAQTYSVSAWIKLASTGTARAIVSYGSGSGLRGWELGSTGGNLFQWRTAAVGAVSGTTAMTTGVWYHVASTCVANAALLNVKVYFNGAEEGSSSGVTATAQNSTDDIIVANAYPGDAAGLGFWNGDIADVAYWTAQLDVNEILALAGGVRPHRIQFDALKFFAPIGLDSPEPEYTGLGISGTLSGSPTLSDGPPIVQMTPKRRYFTTSGAAVSHKSLSLSGVG